MDFFVKAAEVNPTIQQLQAGGLDILTVHNHLFGDSPEVVYVHDVGRGDPEKLTNPLKDGLSKTKTPMEATKTSDARATAEGF